MTPLTAVRTSPETRTAAMRAADYRCQTVDCGARASYVVEGGTVHCGQHATAPQSTSGADGWY